MRTRLAVSALALLLPTLSLAAPPAYRIEQGTFNNGGNPAPILSSTSYRITLDAVGDGVAAATLTGTSYGISTGLPAVYSPPGEVLNLEFPGETTLTWNPETSVGSYNVYRGDCATLSSSYGSKVQSGISGATTTDGEEPVAGQCFFYLITASNRLDEEGTKGTDSFGNPRP